MMGPRLGRRIRIEWTRGREPGNGLPKLLSQDLGKYWRRRGEYVELSHEASVKRLDRRLKLLGNIHLYHQNKKTLHSEHSVFLV